MPARASRSAIATLIAVACLPSFPAGAQAPQPLMGTIPPVVGSSYGNTATTRYSNPLSDPNRYRQTDSFGKLCLGVNGYGRPFATNPNLYDHVIVAINNCPKRINFEVCYYQTRNCLTVEMPPQQRKEVILGIQPGVKDFRYEFREKQG
jgi:hypothetical protein